MKLLKDYNAAAQTLEQAQYFQEAAAIYLNRVQNKNKAAECYEKGHMTNEAISIYKELSAYEKVGDLYLSIQNRKEANVYFEKTAESYKQMGQYLKAALIYKNKMNDIFSGQAFLLEGWRRNKDAANCLKNYFDNIADPVALKQEINSIYTRDLTPENSVIFLGILHLQYKKNTSLSPSIKEMAYEVVAAQIKINPQIVTELKGFNPLDKELTKDTIRFKIGKKR